MEEQKKVDKRKRSGWALFYRSVEKWRATQREELRQEKEYLVRLAANTVSWKIRARKIGLIFALVLLTAAIADAQALSARLDCQDNSDNEDGFIFERRLNLGVYIELARPTICAYDDLTLVAGTVANVYSYRAAAYNTAGKSGYTNEVAITIPAKPPPPPPPPPVTPAAPSVTMTPKLWGLYCSALVAAAPPDSAGGWTAQFLDGNSNFSNSDNAAPYTRTANVWRGSHSFRARWTKVGQTLTSATTVKGCP